MDFCMCELKGIVSYPSKDGRNCTTCGKWYDHPKEEDLTREEKEPLSPEELFAMENGVYMSKAVKKAHRKARKRAGLSFSDIMKEKIRIKNLQRVNG